MTAVVLRGDAAHLPLPDGSVDAIVTDPPYGLEFMGREWDGADGFRRSLNEADAGRDSVFGRASRTSPEYVAGPLFQRWCEAWARECLRVLKPGGHLLAFGGTRTWHRLVCGIEDAGFEIRDSIDWIYGSGFPKNPACLKPAHEPIVMARKPSRRSGPLPGLDGCRVEAAGRPLRESNQARESVSTYGDGLNGSRAIGTTDVGRWPPNVVLGEEAAAELDRQSGVLTSGSRKAGTYGLMGYGGHPARPMPGISGDSGGASRFFPVFRYEAKADAAERPRLPDGTAWPTVKPVELIQWLARLVTPPGGRVLDLFCGTGTTAEACAIEGFDCILIDRDPQAVALTKIRLARTIQPVMFGLDDGMPA